MKVLLLGGEIGLWFFGDLLKLLEENGVGYSTLEATTDPAEIAEATKEHGAVITFVPAVSKEMIEAFDSSVKGLVVTSIGYDNIDVKAATKKGIRVCNIPDYSTEEVALHSVAMILASVKNLCLHDKSVRAGEWKTRSMVCGRPRHRLSTMTLGFMGFGRIGQEMARMMAGFGVKFIAYDPYLPLHVFDEMNVESVSSPDTIYKHSDIISINMLLNDETYHVIGKDSIAKMKDGVIIVNTARGALLDLESVTRELESGKIGAVGIDVFEEEPIPADHPLLKDENAIVSSHCAYNSIEANLDLRTKSLMTAVKLCKGETPYNCVNKKGLGLA
jgi:D-3-phosphoglycerate dehydrogenase / 2-oxoglutarate reductase